jgi:IS5 family transposase
MRSGTLVGATIIVAPSSTKNGAKTHDSRIWYELLLGNETSIWADKSYVSSSREAAFSEPSKFWGVMRKAPTGGALSTGTQS